jgi:hypothetical protein
MMSASLADFKKITQNTRLLDRAPRSFRAMRREISRREKSERSRNDHARAARFARRERPRMGGLETKSKAGGARARERFAAVLSSAQLAQAINQGSLITPVVGAWKFSRVDKLSEGTSDG